MGDILDSILSIAKGIAKAGLGDDIATALSYEERKVAKNIAESKALKKFNGFGLTANADFDIDINGVAKSIKKGQSINANDYKELKEFSKKGKIGFSHIQDAKTRGELDTAFREFQQDYSKIIDQNGDIIKTNGTDFMKFIDREGKTSIGLGNALNGYLGDEKYGATRTKAALVGTAGAGVGLRYLQGGNLTTKANGERDIAGIPFI